ncbi:MAG TPA: AAA family ATPase [Kofleriaceae bacterium]|nr:AAA family ATPase [Kofleriaceae bacterium]
MLRRFALRDFKGHRDTQLELGRFTMLVGDNASGKTSVLDALALQASFGRRPIDVLQGNWSVDDLRRRGSNGPIVLATEGGTAALAWRVMFSLQQDPLTVPSGRNPVPFDFRGAPGVPAHGASHGTLIVVALLAILHGEHRPNLILLDDFDHALHPRAQMELVRMLKRLLALEAFTDVQVVATTHSPYMLDELEPSEIQVFALRDDGTVASRRLSEHPEAAKTRGALAAGQLWSLDPERDWVLRG